MAETKIRDFLQKIVRNPLFGNHSYMILLSVGGRNCKNTQVSSMTTIMYKLIVPLIEGLLGPSCRVT